VDDPILLSRLKIRTVGAEDLPALEWDGEFTHFRLLYQDVYAQALQGNAVMWLVQLEGDGIIGQVFVSLVSRRSELADGKRRAYIYGFRVKPPYRSRGVGAYLMRWVEADLVRRGFYSATLNVARDNYSARKLYERLGYRVVAPEPGNWSYIDHLGQRHEVHEPAWRMEKILGKD